MSKRLTIAVTAGDPCGIGPEVVLKTVAAPIPPWVRLVVIGDRAVFEQAARASRLRLPRWAVAEVQRCSVEGRHRITFLDQRHPWHFKPGVPSKHAGRASLNYLDAAIGLCRQGLADALVTAPVTKRVIELTGKSFVGQTEYLAEGLGASFPVMMFVSERLRVVLVTRHLALQDVPSRVTSGHVRQTIRVTLEGLRRWFGIRKPRLAVCGLNPHAGEGGRFGDEERRVLPPLLREFNRDTVKLEGPFAADGFFANLGNPRGRHRRYDAVVCWYHDQGLIPFKLMAKGQGCQLSLGLPVIRTSPDHGTALDIAGKGRADPRSMRYALRLAEQLLLSRDAHQD